MYKFFILLIFLIPLKTISQQDNTYYTGVASNADLEKAKQDAMKSMLEQIQVFVSSSVKRKLSETNTALNETTSVEIIAKSSMQLQDVQEEIMKDADNIFHVKKFIARDIVKKIFALRKQKTIEHLLLAQSESKKGNIGTALKNYYWALLLTEMYPDTISFTFSNGIATSNLSSAIANEMENIVRNIHCSAVKKIDDEHLVWKYNVEYKSKLVSHLYFEYFDGQGQTQGEVRNGEAKLTFYFSQEENIEREILLNVHYAYEDEMDELLQLAHSVRINNTIANTVVFTLPGARTKPNTGATMSDTHTTNLPAPISTLLTTKNFDGVTSKLDSLVKKNKLITGSAKDFESREGLFAAIIDQNGIVALVRFEKQKYYNAKNMSEIDITHYAGMRIIWIEVLK